MPRRADRRPADLATLSGKPVDRRDIYRMVVRIAKTAGVPRHISPHSLRHAAITNALDAGVPLRDAQILARHADPRTTEHYDRARGNLDRHGVHFLTAYVVGVCPARVPLARNVAPALVLVARAVERSPTLAGVRCSAVATAAWVQMHTTF